MAEITKSGIKELLKTKRERLADSSANTYASLLVNLAKQNGGGNMDWFDGKPADILEAIDKRVNLQTKKTVLSAMFILTGKPEYQEKMITICKTVNEKYKTQQVSESRKDAFIPFDEVRQKYHDLMAVLKRSPTPENYVDFLLVALLSGVLIEPRRSEWIYVKIRDYDKTTDNYFLKDTFVFNRYKTFHKYGQQL
jgi:hypothetical protein